MWVRAFSRGCTTTSPMPFACSTAAACSVSPGPAAGGRGQRGPDHEAARGQLLGQRPGAVDLGGARPPLRGGHSRRRRCRAASGAGAHRLGGGPDVRRRGAAAAAHQGDPSVGEPAEVPGEVPAVDAELERARPDPARLPGVRLGADRHRRVPDQVLGDDQHPLRPDRAVRADHRDRHRADSTDATSRGVSPPSVCASSANVACAISGTSVTDAATRHGLDQFVQVAERLQDQQVGARPSGDQGEDLLAEHLHPLGRPDPAALQRGDRGRHRARDEHGAVRTRSGRAGEPHPGPVDLVHLVGEPVVAEPQPVRAERVGLDDVRARAQVAVVDGLHQAGLGQVQLGQRPVERRSRGVQHRAHRAVADEHPLPGQQPPRGLVEAGPVAEVPVESVTITPPATRRGSPAPPARSAGPCSCPAAAR